MATPQKAQPVTNPQPVSNPTEVKQAKPGELKSLFKTYEEKQKAVKAAEVALEKAMGERSKVVEQFAAYGKSFLYQGERFIVMRREITESVGSEKRGTGKFVYFFRGEGDRTAIEIE